MQAPSKLGNRTNAARPKSSIEMNERIAGARRKTQKAQARIKEQRQNIKSLSCKNRKKKHNLRKKMVIYPNEGK